VRNTLRPVCWVALDWLGVFIRWCRWWERGPCLALNSPGGKVRSRFEERVLVGTARSTLHRSGHVQLPNRVLFLCSPCAPRQQVPCSTSRVVLGAHRVVGPGTHQSSGPRDVYTTSPRALCSRGGWFRVVLMVLMSSPWASPSSTSQKSSRILESSWGWKVLQLILE
jgi:hypothetical protein